MKLKIWWLPGLPGPSFEKEVGSVEEGHRLLDTLVDYTRYLERRGLMPVYSADVGGVQAWEDGEWVDAEVVLDDSAAWQYRGAEV